MNRLIIIGNGFDLAHGIKTSYHDFILDYLKESLKICVSSYRQYDVKGYGSVDGFYDDELLQIILKQRFANIKYEDLISKISTLSECKELIKEYFECNYKFIFLKNIISKACNYSWVNIETEYFEALLDLKITKTNAKEIENFNVLFEIFKEKLVKYIKNQQDEFTNSFDSLALCDCFCEDILDVDVDVKTIGTHPPKRLLFINFNYTNTLEPYVEECRKRILSDINYIHGSVNNENNPPIFGFGDEFDKRYKEFEDEGNNELFKHIKSFGYLKTNNYSDLTRFLEVEPFQVQVYGHSCGLSDRTMFKEIFEHKNCRSIKVFYYEEFDNEGNFVKDNFTEIIQNISRHFDDKKKMRAKIVNKGLSDPLPQIQLPKK